MPTYCAMELNEFDWQVATYEEIQIKDRSYISGWTMTPALVFPLDPGVVSVPYKDDTLGDCQDAVAPITWTYEFFIYDDTRALVAGPQGTTSTTDWTTT